VVHESVGDHCEELGVVSASEDTMHRNGLWKKSAVVWSFDEGRLLACDTRAFIWIPQWGWTEVVSS
jgi:hypothetical protein